MILNDIGVYSEYFVSMFLIINFRLLALTLTLPLSLMYKYFSNQVHIWLANVLICLPFLYGY